MKHYIIFIFFVIFVLISCHKNKYNIHDYHNNGVIASKYCELNDTIIYGKIFNLREFLFYNINGILSRRGTYIKNQPIGEHLFYSDSIPIIKREYVIWHPELINIAKKIKSNTNTFKTPDSTHLNTITYYHKDKVEKKLYVEKKIEIKNDSILIKFKCFVSDIDIQMVDYILYNIKNEQMIFRREDGSVSKNFMLAKSDKKDMTGFVVIKGFVKNKLPQDTVRKAVTVYLNKIF